MVAGQGMRLVPPRAEAARRLAAVLLARARPAPKRG
jgi:hypothetical protein